MRYPPSCPPLREFTNTNRGLASSGKKLGSMLMIGWLSPPFAVCLEIFRMTFLVTRVIGDRSGASWTHSGGRINARCFDS